MALTLQQAAARARKSPGTIRNWCESEGLGRRIGGGWCISKVAMDLFLDGEATALGKYLRGDRKDATVVAYFKRHNLSILIPVLDVERTNTVNIPDMVRGFLVKVV